MALKQNKNPKKIVADGYDQIADAHIDWCIQVRQEERAKYTRVLLEQLPDEATVLELGCGAGLPTTRLLADRFSVTGVDISTKQLEMAAQNVPDATYLHSDMTELDLPANSFDAVAAFYSLLHIPREEQPGLLRKIGKWLKPGGLLVASMWPEAASATFEEDWLGAPMYWSGLDQETTERIVVDIGLRIVSAKNESFEEFGRTITFLWLVAEKPADDEDPDG